jgi:hypothetical protein
LFACDVVKKILEKGQGILIYLVSFYEGKINDGGVVGLDSGNGFR